MSYVPRQNVYQRSAGRPRIGTIPRAVPRALGAYNSGYMLGAGVGGGGLGATPAVASTVAKTAVSEIPVIGPILSNFVGPILSIFDPGAKIDASRQQRADGIEALANQGSLLAARQLLGGATGAVGAAKEKAIYVQKWASFQTTHAALATAAKAAGSAGVGPDPHGNPWAPPAADVAQYQQEITAYRSSGAAATAAQVVQARTAGFPGGVTGILAVAGILGAILRRR